MIPPPNITSSSSASLTGTATISGPQFGAMIGGGKSSGLLAAGVLVAAGLAWLALRKRI